MCVRGRARCSGSGSPNTYPNDGVQLLHGDLFGAFDRLQHLLLVFTLQTWQQLTDERAETLGDFGLQIHCVNTNKKTNRKNRISFRWIYLFKAQKSRTLYYVCYRNIVICCACTASTHTPRDELRVVMLPPHRSVPQKPEARVSD